jgi:hypothetical protein
VGREHFFKTKAWPGGGAISGVVIKQKILKNQMLSFTEKNYNPEISGQHFVIIPKNINTF